MNNGMNPYLKQKIMSASPEQLVCYIYDKQLFKKQKQDSTKNRNTINMSLFNNFVFANFACFELPEKK